MVGDLINQAYIMEPSQKPQMKGSGKLLGRRMHPWASRVAHPTPRGQESCSGDPSGPLDLAIPLYPL